MGAFEIKQEATESADGKVLTFIDNSNWTDNDEGYLKADFIRTFTLTDAYGEPIDVLVLPTTENSITYDVPTDTQYLWVNSVFTIEGVEDFTDTSKYGFNRKVKNLYREILKKGCCKDKDSDKALNGADRFFRGASIEALSGNAPAWMVDNSGAYTYLNN